MAAPSTGRRPGTAWALVLAVVLGAWPALAQTAAPSEGFDAGVEALRQGRYTEAVAAFSHAIETHPGDHEAYNNRGYARIFSGDYAGAVADCSRALEIAPRSAKAYNNRGYARIFLQDYDAAVADFNRALELNPRYVDAFSNRALTASRRGAFAEAIRDCDRALAINPRATKALYHRGYARDRQGDPVGALGDYLQVLEINPDHLEVCNNVAWILATAPEERLRDGARAVRLAERSASRNPSASFLDTLGAAYAEAGRFTEAVAALTRLMDDLPADLTAEQRAPYAARLDLYRKGQAYRETRAAPVTDGVPEVRARLAALDRLPGAPPSSRDSLDGVPAAVVRPAAFTTETGRAVVAQAAAGEPLMAQAQEVATAVDTPATIVLEGRPAAEANLAFELESVPTHGTLSGTLPRLEYRPRPGFTGVDRFAFRVTDGARTSDPAWVTILVGVAAPPSAPTPAPADAPAPQPPPAPPAVKAPPAAAETPPPVTEETPAPAAPLAAEEPPPAEAAPPAETAATQEPASGATPSISSTTSTSSTPSTTSTENLTPNLPPDAIYTIQVYAVRDAAAAAKAAAALQADGFTAFTRPVDLAQRGIWHRVFINGYPSLEDARTALELLDRSRFPDAYVRRLPPDVRPGAAAAPPPPPPAAGSFPYAYQVASRREADQALRVAEDLADRGFTAYLGSNRLPDGALWHHVFAGAFATLEDGRPLGEQLARAGYAEAFPVAVPFTLLVRRTDAGADEAAAHARLKSLGHLAYRLPGDGEDVWRIGGFQERGDAEEARRRLVEAGVAAEVAAR